MISIGFVFYAISTGALIAIAAQQIYMRQGASIGAATVVDASGAEVFDKYQSFMRAAMRATAESHGRRLHPCFKNCYLTGDIFISRSNIEG